VGGPRNRVVKRLWCRDDGIRCCPAVENWYEGHNSVTDMVSVQALNYFQCFNDVLGKTGRASGL